jgi:hypothetical protein
MGKITNVQVTRRMIVGLVGSIESAQHRAAYLLSRAQDRDAKAERYLRQILDGLETAYRPTISLFRYLGGAKFGLDSEDEDEGEDEEA